MRLDIITIALKNLRRKGFRTVILIVSISTVVSLLIFAVSFALSIHSSIKRTSERLGADLIIVPIGARDFAEEFLLEAKNKSFYMSKDVVRRVKKIDGIELVTYQTYLETIGGVCCDVSKTQVVAFDQDTDFIIKPWIQKSLGRRLMRGEAIAGYQTYENLGLDLLDVEKTLFNKRFKVIGVLDKTGTGLDNALFMTEDDLQEIIDSGNSPIKKGEVSIVFAKVKDGLDPYYVSLLVEGEIAEIDAVPRRKMGENILKAFNDINNIFIISIAITTILTVSLAAIIFSAIVNERSREIGIMRAIGAKKAHITKIFLFEALCIGVIGSVVGTIGGTLLATLVMQGFTIIKNLSATLTLVDRIGIAVLGLFAGISMCISGAIFPINRIREKEPLLAIKCD